MATINFSTILKRSRCANSLINESTKVDSEKKFANLKELMKTRPSRDGAVQQLLRSYIESMCNTESASQYYYEPLELMENFNDSDKVVAGKILTEYTTRIIPYMANPSIVTEAIRRYTLTDDQIKSIVESATIYTAADRIIKNHESISKRFNIERECNRYNSVGLKYFIDSCADMIDTYNIKSYQKMNLTIEECCYILEKNGLKYNKKDISKYVIEYYLSQNPYISDHELNNFRKAINESYMLESDDKEYAEELLTSTDDNSSIESAIRNYLLLNDKDSDNLAQMINAVLAETSKEDIIENISRIIYLIWDFAKNKTFDSDEGLYDCIQIIVRHISDCTKLMSDIDSTTDDYSKEDVEDIINTFSDIKDDIETLGNSNPAYSNPAIQFSKCALKPAITELNYIKNILYSKSNLDAIKYVNSANESATLAINEYKLFKFHNLVNAAFNLDKFLRAKERNLYNKAKNKVSNFVRKTKNVLFGESGQFDNNIYRYIGEDNKANICVRQYPYEESELEEITSFLESVCNEYNDMLCIENLDNTARVYYVINPGVAEICIKESSAICLTEEEKALAMNTLDSSIDTYLETFVETSKEYKNYDGFVGSPIEEQILNFSNYSNFTIDHFEATLEALQYLDIDKDTIRVFGEKFNDYQFNKSLEEHTINETYSDLAIQEAAINNMTDNWEKLDDVPGNIQLEAYGLLVALLNEANGSSSPVGTGNTVDERLKSKGYLNDDDEDEDDDEDDDDEDEDTKKETKKSTSTNTAHSSTNTGASTTTSSNKKKADKPFIDVAAVKLGLMGLKTKFKEMDTKQKEMSQNLDNSVRSIVTGMKEALVSDRREAIIKGSIVPSFSRCIKNAIVLAGLGIATQTVVVPVIVAIGGMAVSKKLTDKARLLLMDEIETELEVVDKELAIADSNNQIKKYRALLQYKKDLQRQYQRIRYNIRVGKDILPGSTAGMVSSNRD